MVNSSGISEHDDNSSVKRERIQEFIYFCEVHSKQKKIISVARYYLMKHGLDEWTPCRFDVIAVDDDEVTVLKNAFEGSQ